MEKPLPPLENLFLESVNAKGYVAGVGLPHPMERFAPDGSLLDIAYADAVVGFIVDTTLEEYTQRYQTARWFLLESEQAFFVVCSRAGIDAEKLRRHLRNQIL